MGAGGGAFTGGALTFFPMPSLMRNTSGVDSGDNCAGGGFADAAKL